MDINSFSEYLSAYFDKDLEPQICKEIENMVCYNEECRVLFNTFKKTIELCKGAEDTEIPSEVLKKLYNSLKLER